MLYMYMSEKTIMENLMELKDKNPKYIYLIVNKEFDDKLREELF